MSETFDPKTVYRKLDLREIIGDRPIRYELQQKDWPAQEMAYLRLYTDDGRDGWVLIAPGSTPKTVAASVRSVADRLARETCGGDACGL